LCWKILSVERRGEVEPVGQVRRMLTMEDREEITRGIVEGLSGKQIAVRIGRDPGLVSREIHRGGGRGFYRAVRSHRDAGQRRRRPKLAKLAAEAKLREAVLDMLRKGYSPDQTAGRLRLEHPDDESMHVSHEAIYTWIYALPVGELAKLGIRLRSGRTRRKPAKGRVPKSPNITNIRWIDERPAEAEGRQVPGHWEGDLVIGKNGASAVATLVERQSRYLILVPVNARDSETVTAAVAERVVGLPDTLRRTLTWDCGSEMAAHATLADTIDVYFAHPHSPWERGTNEGSNRWVREYLPRGTVIPTDRDLLDPIEDAVNDRPRRILGYRKPKEVFAELLLQAIASTG
jgi:transposase, IS30 family